MGGVHWKKEEIEFLRKNYPDKDQNFIIENLPGRLWKAIGLKSHFLGISRNSDIAYEQRSKTNLEKYGVENTFQSEEIKEKIKKTNLDNLGVENPQQCEKIKEKTKKTNLNKYGHECTFQSDVVKEKIKETNTDRYGVPYPQQNKEIHLKSIKTNNDRYGVSYPQQNKEIKEKTKKTNLEIYGCEYPTQNIEVKEKTKKTNLEVRGVENPFQSKEVKEKIKKTNLEVFGVENPQQSEVIKEQKRETNTARYGVPYTFQAESIKEKIRQTNLKIYDCAVPLHSEITKKNNLEKYGKEYLNQLPGSIAKMRETNLKKYGVEITSQSPEIQKKINITKRENNSFHISKPEEDLFKFIKYFFHSYTIERNYSLDPRYPHACDFYIPELDFFIEFQGSWTHGFEPFNGENIPKEWLDKKEKSKYYKKAIEVFSIKDPEKRKEALNANLNYLEIWNSDLKKSLDYLSTLLLKQGLPICHSQENIQKEFEDISKKVGDFSANPYHNKIVINFQKHFYRKERYLWNNPKIRQKLISNREFYKNKDCKDISNKQYLSGFKISGIHRGYSFFSPLWIKGFIEKYNVKSVYDPCAGWGHRLLGSVNVRYIGNDACKETYSGLCAIRDTFKLNNVFLYNNLAENFIPEEKYEAVFTCPPYYNTEIYDGEETSTSRYLDYTSWLNTWWRSVIKNSIKNRPKYFSFVINNKYREDMKDICIQEGLILLEEISVGRNPLNHFQRKKDISLKKGEFLLIFKLKEL